MLPVTYKGIYMRYRHSLFKSQKIMTNKNLLGLVARHNEINFRVRVVSLTKETIRVEHSPLFELGAKSPQPGKREVVPTDEQ